jgi:hypothetical protein
MRGDDEMRKTILFGVAFSGLLGLLVPAAGFDSPAYAQDASCDARENFREVAVSFISRCCKGSIYREFPGELLFTTIAEIQRGSTAAHKKAWKLLNDNRFKK